MCPLFLSAITPQCHQTLLKTTLAANHSPCFRFDNGFDMSSHSFKGGRGKPKATISVSRSSKAGLQFHVGRIALFLKSGKYAKRVGRPQVSRRGGMSNLQAAYAAAFKNVRPSAEDLAEDLALTVTSCWKEDPNDRPNFSQIIQMLMHYLSTISPSKPAIPQRIFRSDNVVLPPESPGISSLMATHNELGETPKADMEEKSKVFSSALTCVVDTQINHNAKPLCGL